MDDLVLHNFFALKSGLLQNTFRLLTFLHTPYTPQTTDDDLDPSSLGSKYTLIAYDHGDKEKERIDIASIDSVDIVTSRRGRADEICIKTKSNDSYTYICQGGKEDLLSVIYYLREKVNKWEPSTFYVHPTSLPRVSLAYTHATPNESTLGPDDVAVLIIGAATISMANSAGNTIWTRRIKDLSRLIRVMRTLDSDTTELGVEFPGQEGPCIYRMKPQDKAARDAIIDMIQAILADSYRIKVGVKDVSLVDLNTAEKVEVPLQYNYETLVTQTGQSLVIGVADEALALRDAASEAVKSKIVLRQITSVSVPDGDDHSFSLINAVPGSGPSSPSATSPSTQNALITSTTTLKSPDRDIILAYILDAALYADPSPALLPRGTVSQGTTWSPSAVAPLLEIVCGEQAERAVGDVDGKIETYFANKLASLVGSSGGLAQGVGMGEVTRTLREAAASIPLVAGQAIMDKQSKLWSLCLELGSSGAYPGAVVVDSVRVLHRLVLASSRSFFEDTIVSARALTLFISLFKSPSVAVRCSAALAFESLVHRLTSSGSTSRVPFFVSLANFDDMVGEILRVLGDVARFHSHILAGFMFVHTLVAIGRLSGMLLTNAVENNLELMLELCYLPCGPVSAAVSRLLHAHFSEARPPPHMALGEFQEYARHQCGLLWQIYLGVSSRCERHWVIHANLIDVLVRDNVASFELITRIFPEPLIRKCRASRPVTAPVAVAPKKRGGSSMPVSEAAYPTLTPLINWIEFFNQVHQKIEMPDMVWNGHVKKELCASIEQEQLNFHVARRSVGSFAGGCVWNSNEFCVYYKALESELPIGRYYLKQVVHRLPLVDIEDPEHFQNELLLRLYAQDAPTPLQGTYIRVLVWCLATYKKFSLGVLNMRTIVSLYKAAPTPQVAAGYLAVILEVISLPISHASSQSSASSAPPVSLLNSNQTPSAATLARQFLDEGGLDIIVKNLLWVQTPTEQLTSTSVLDAEEGNPDAVRLSMSLSLLKLCLDIQPPLTPEGALRLPLSALRVAVSRAPTFSHLVQLIALLPTDSSYSKVVAQILDLVAEVTVRNAHTMAAGVGGRLADVTRSGLLFFLLQYQGPDFFPISQFLHLVYPSVEHVMRALFPAPMVDLVASRPQRFAEIFTSEAYTPRLVWNQEMRLHLVHHLRTHLASFMAEVHKNGRTIYEYTDIAPITYPMLDAFLVCNGYYVNNLLTTLDDVDNPKGILEQAQMMFVDLISRQDDISSSVYEGRDARQSLPQLLVQLHDAHPGLASGFAHFPELLQWLVRCSSSPDLIHPSLQFSLASVRTSPSSLSQFVAQGGVKVVCDVLHAYLDSSTSSPKSLGVAISCLEILQRALPSLPADEAIPEHMCADIVRNLGPAIPTALVAPALCALQAIITAPSARITLPVLYHNGVHYHVLYTLLQDIPSHNEEHDQDDDANPTPVAITLEIKESILALSLLVREASMILGTLMPRLLSPYHISILQGINDSVSDKTLSGFVSSLTHVHITPTSIWGPSMLGQLREFVHARVTPGGESKAHAAPAYTLVEAQLRVGQVYITPFISPAAVKPPTMEHPQDEGFPVDQFFAGSSASRSSRATPKSRATEHTSSAPSVRINGAEFVAQIIDSLIYILEVISPDDTFVRQLASSGRELGRASLHVPVPPGPGEPASSLWQLVQALKVQVMATNNSAQLDILAGKGIPLLMCIIDFAKDDAEHVGTALSLFSHVSGRASVQHADRNLHLVARLGRVLVSDEPSAHQVAVLKVLSSLVGACSALAPSLISGGAVLHLLKYVLFGPPPPPTYIPGLSYDKGGKARKEHEAKVAVFQEQRLWSLVLLSTAMRDPNVTQLFAFLDKVLPRFLVSSLASIAPTLSSVGPAESIAPDSVAAKAFLNLLTETHETSDLVWNEDMIRQAKEWLAGLLVGLREASSMDTVTLDMIPRVGYPQLDNEVQIAGVLVRLFHKTGVPPSQPGPYLDAVLVLLAHAGDNAMHVASSSEVHIPPSVPGLSPMSAPVSLLLESLHRLLAAIPRLAANIDAAKPDHYAAVCTLLSLLAHDSDLKVLRQLTTILRTLATASQSGWTMTRSSCLWSVTAREPALFVSAVIRVMGSAPLYDFQGPILELLASAIKVGHENMCDALLAETSETVSVLARLASEKEPAMSILYTLRKQAQQRGGDEAVEAMMLRVRNGGGDRVCTAMSAYESFRVTDVFLSSSAASPAISSSAYTFTPPSASSSHLSSFVGGSTPPKATFDSPMSIFSPSASLNIPTTTPPSDKMYSSSPTYAQSMFSSPVFDSSPIGTRVTHSHDPKPPKPTHSSSPSYAPSSPSPKVHIVPPPTSYVSSHDPDLHYSIPQPSETSEPPKIDLTAPTVATPPSSVSSPIQKLPSLSDNSGSGVHEQDIFATMFGSSLSTTPPAPLPISKPTRTGDGPPTPLPTVNNNDELFSMFGGALQPEPSSPVPASHLEKEKSGHTATPPAQLAAQQAKGSKPQPSKPQTSADDIFSMFGGQL
eukprot:TRINITY_DN4540_c0_g1_i3.p1 TRINITY_DN4540_c0_g1~~TRINITY_DN4540_c0_g1_i3.p1  ORF type:complete len:2503 (-),score=478.19 TRINITY_DN4540_c0_g1_i3:37-7545(-)